MQRNKEPKQNEKGTPKRITRDANRGQWATKTEFVFTLLGYAIGIGNVWRFPYLCYRSGGAAFLVPYLLMVIVCGIPMFYIEVLIGQFSGTGCTGMFRLVPLLKGTGICIVIVNIYCLCYYSVIISYPIRFLYYCFWTTVPWVSCNHPWNTANCTTIDQMNENSVMGSASTDEFFHLEVLRISGNIEHLGGMVWQLLISLLISWVVVFLCVIRGVKSVGKVSYFTASFPYVLLTILFFRGITLPGAVTGIKFFLYPEWKRLLDLNVWSDAAIQMFFGLGPGWGGIVNMASFNKFRNNAKFDSIVVVSVNVFTSLYAGVVVFSVLGFLSKLSGVPVATVATSGAGLAFITYPQAIAMMPVPQLWAVMFFAMLFILGVNTVFVQLECVTSSLLDEVRFLRKYKLWVSMCLCLIFFGLSSVMCTHAGMYILQLLDWYSSAISIIVICIVEIIMVSYIYGIDNFMTDIEFMMGKRPSRFWKITWKYTTPIVLVFILLTSVIFMREISYNGVKYPTWAIALGWLSFVSSVIWIVLYIFYIMIIKRKTLCSSLKRRLKPLDWTPADPDVKAQYEDYRRQRNLPSFMSDTEPETDSAIRSKD